MKLRATLANGVALIPIERMPNLWWASRDRVSSNRPSFRRILRSGKAPTRSWRVDCAGLASVRVAHDDLGGEQLGPDSARRVAQHCSDAFE